MYAEGSKSRLNISLKLEDLLFIKIPSVSSHLSANSYLIVSAYENAEVCIQKIIRIGRN